MTYLLEGLFYPDDIVKSLVVYALVQMISASEYMYVPYHVISSICSHLPRLMTDSNSDDLTINLMGMILIHVLYMYCNHFFLVNYYFCAYRFITGFVVCSSSCKLSFGGYYTCKRYVGYTWNVHVNIRHYLLMLHHSYWISVEECR